ncbi:MAG: hypothetical protein IKZ07_05165 [Akkermansia sp.]|nr:hypothetical protein [Akkermansia sp.]
MAVRFRTRKDIFVLINSQNRRRRIFACSLAGGLVVFLGILFWMVNIFIEQEQEAAFLIYQPEEVSNESSAPKREMSSKVKPVQPNLDIIVSDAASDVDFMTDVEIDTAALEMTGDTLADGLAGGGDGIGEGVGEGGGSGLGSSVKTENAFEGRFWDFKKTPAGAPSKLKDVKGNREVLNIMSRFYNSGWNTTAFSPYCEAKTRLFSSCFYLPNCMDQEASNAYDPKGKMGLKPSRWVALYRARVQAPKSGRFRFVGVGDSVMAVRFDGRNVLACGFHDLKTAEWNGLHVVSNPNALQGKDVIDYKSCDFWNEQVGGFVAGEPFDVKSGEWYEMQVLVSEIGGGNFGFCLLIDDMDEEGGKVSEDGKPVYQLFRTSFIAPKAAEVYDMIKYKDMELATDPPYDEDSLIWPAKPLKIGSRGK